METNGISLGNKKNILLKIMGYFMGYRFITKFFAPLGRYENQPKYCSEDGGFN